MNGICKYFRMKATKQASIIPILCIHGLIPKDVRLILSKPSMIEIIYRKCLKNIVTEILRILRDCQLTVLI